MSLGTEYEEFVERVIREKEAENWSVTRQKALSSSTGRKILFDVVMEMQIELGFRITIVLECKCWSKRINVGLVQEFKAKLLEVGSPRGIMVTTAGYQSGAVQYASENGIGLLVLRDEEEGRYLVEMVSEGVVPSKSGEVMGFLVPPDVLYGVFGPELGINIHSFADLYKAIRLYWSGGEADSDE